MSVVDYSTFVVEVLAADTTAMLECVNTHITAEQ